MQIFGVSIPLLYARRRRRFLLASSFPCYETARRATTANQGRADHRLRRPSGRIEGQHGLQQGSPGLVHGVVVPMRIVSCAGPIRVTRVVSDDQQLGRAWFFSLERTGVLLMPKCWVSGDMIYFVEASRYGVCSSKFLPSVGAIFVAPPYGTNPEPVSL